MVEYMQVVTTTDSQDAALALARGVVRARLGSAGQIYPIRSVYWWDSAVQDEEEWQVVFKTTRQSADELVEHVRKHHTYVVPEIIVTAIESGHHPYLSWIDEETQRSSLS